MVDWQAEFRDDPAGLGYAPWVGVDDARLADLANALDGPGAATVNLRWASRDGFLSALTPAVMALATKDAATQAKWDRVLANIRAADTVDLAVGGPLLDLAVADGLMDRAAVAAMLSRTGSRAELLEGPGFVLTTQAVSAAFGRF